MGLDQLLELTSNVAAKALPIVGVIVLIFLVIFVRHLIVLLKSANEAVISMKKHSIRQTKNWKHWKSLYRL